MSKSINGRRRTQWKRYQRSYHRFSDDNCTAIIYLKKRYLSRERGASFCKWRVRPPIDPILLGASYLRVTYLKYFFLFIVSTFFDRKFSRIKCRNCFSSHSHQFSSRDFIVINRSYNKLNIFLVNVTIGSTLRFNILFQCFKTQYPYVYSLIFCD